MKKFANVSCSQCGRDFGPGDHGFSHCEHHLAPLLSFKLNVLDGIRAQFADDRLTSAELVEQLTEWLAEQRREIRALHIGDGALSEDVL